MTYNVFVWWDVKPYSTMDVVLLFQIGNILDSYAATLTKRGDHDVFYMTTQGISQLVQRSHLYFSLSTV